MINISNIEILKGTTFLVVDNSKLVYRAMRTMFRRFGIETLFAARADEVSLAIEHSVDAIIRTSIFPTVMESECVRPSDRIMPPKPCLLLY